MKKKSKKVWCTCCNKPRHTRDKCWKLYGKPQSKDWGYKGGPPKRGGQAAHVAAVLLPKNY